MIFKSTYDLMAFVDECFANRAELFGYLILQRGLRFNPDSHALQHLDKYIHRWIFKKPSINWNAQSFNHITNEFGLKNGGVEALLKNIGHLETPMLFYSNISNMVYFDPHGFHKNQALLISIVWCLLENRCQPLKREEICEMVNDEYNILKFDDKDLNAKMASVNRTLDRCRDYIPAMKSGGAQIFRHKKNISIRPKGSKIGLPIKDYKYQIIVDGITNYGVNYCGSLPGKKSKLFMK